MGTLSFSGFGVEWKVIGIAEMAPFHIGKNRGADHAEFFDATVQFDDARFDVLLRQRSGAFDSFWVLGAILGQPTITRGSKRSGEAGVFQCGQCPGQAGAEKHGDVDVFAVHVDQTRFRIGHAGTARVRPAVRAADTDAESVGARPGFSLDDRSQLAVAAVAPLRRFAFILIR